MNVNVGVAAMGKVNGHDGWDWRGGEETGGEGRSPRSTAHFHEVVACFSSANSQRLICTEQHLDWPLNTRAVCVCVYVCVCVCVFVCVCVRGQHSSLS